MDSFGSDDESGQQLTLVASGNHRELAGLESMSGDTDHESFSPDLNQSTSHERSPLIRPRRPSDIITEEVSSLHSTSITQRRYGTVPRKNHVRLESNIGLLKNLTATLSLRPVSVMVFLLIVVIGITLNAAANLNTDNNAVNVEPRHVLVYTMFLMTVFVLWINISILPQKFQYSGNHGGALIPSHLLTGIGIFGMFCAVTQMLVFIDFAKCSRHVENLSAIYGMHPFFKTTFVYFQIYFFYKLSRGGICDQKVPGGNLFIMITLATNMCIWGVAFLNDASNDPKMKDVKWLNHYHYGINGSDPCANTSITSPQAKQLHDIILQLQPYIAAFAMEYALLASGLLLHVWYSLKTPSTSQAHAADKVNWTLWRLGFILGLLSIPFLFVAYVGETTREKVDTAHGVLYGFEFLIYVVLAALSRYCTVLLKKSSNFIKCKQSMPLEVTLLGISIIGFPVLDLSRGLAAIAESKNMPLSLILCYGLSSVAELVAVGVQFLFIIIAYQYKLPGVAGPKVRKSARFIRQFASFSLVVNFGYWAAKTYELRGSSTRSVAEKFYGKYTWFGLSHFCYPLCIFFHFHLAICYANVIAHFSRFGPIHKSG